MLTLFGIKNCDSVKKAKKFLDAHGIEYTFCDFKESPVDTSVIKEWLNKTTMQKLFNSRSTTYKTLGLSKESLDDEKKVALLAEHNLLIKRPVLQSDTLLLVGFKEDEYTKALLS